MARLCLASLVPLMSLTCLPFLLYGEVSLGSRTVCSTFLFIWLPMRARSIPSPYVNQSRTPKWIHYTSISGSQPRMSANYSRSPITGFAVRWTVTYMCVVLFWRVQYLRNLHTNNMGCTKVSGMLLLCQQFISFLPGR